MGKGVLMMWPRQPLGKAAAGDIMWGRRALWRGEGGGERRALSCMLSESVIRPYTSLVQREAMAGPVPTHREAPPTVRSRRSIS